MEIHTLENTTLVSLRARVSINGSKDKYTSVNSKMVSNTVEASGEALPSITAMFTKENTLKTRGTARASSHGQVAMFTGANIRTRRDMDKAK